MTSLYAIMGGDRHEPSVLGVVLDPAENVENIVTRMGAELGSGEVWSEPVPVVTFASARRVRVLRLRLPASNSFLSTSVTSRWSWEDPGPAKAEFTEGGDDPIEIEGTDFGEMLAVLEVELRNRGWSVKP